jgi:hypothetical protein
VTATLIGILGVIPQTWAAIANICLFGKLASQVSITVSSPLF